MSVSSGVVILEVRTIGLRKKVVGVKEGDKQVEIVLKHPW